MRKKKTTSELIDTIFAQIEELEKVKKDIEKERKLIKHERIIKFYQNSKVKVPQIIPNCEKCNWEQIYTSLADGWILDMECIECQNKWFCNLMFFT